MSKKRSQQEFEALFNEIKKGNQVCDVTVTFTVPDPQPKKPNATKEYSVSLSSVKAYPHITGLLNEYGNAWVKGDV